MFYDIYDERYLNSLSEEERNRIMWKWSAID